MRVTLEQHLGEVNADLQAEAAASRELMGLAISALIDQNAQAAADVIARDDHVDELFIAIRESIEALLARQTPVAVDLRLVLSMLDINIHLERMADYCVTIAKLTQLTERLDADNDVLDGFRQMGDQAQRMVDVAMQSFNERDRELAESLMQMDEQIDAANRRLVKRLLDLGADPDLREWGLRMILVSRCIERFGDHAVDIGEQTAYLVTGEFREFTDASEPGG